MAIVSLRTFSDPFYTCTVNLDGSDYLFEWRYNQREDAWYFDIALTDGTTLARGIKVVCLLPLLKRFADSRLPKGQLIAWPNTDSRKLPGLDELGEDRRVTLLYFDESELTS